MAWTIEEAVSSPAHFREAMTSMHLFREGKLTLFNCTLPPESAAIFDVGIVQALVILEYATGVEADSTLLPQKTVQPDRRPLRICFPEVGPCSLNPSSEALATTSSAEHQMLLWCTSGYQASTAASDRAFSGQKKFGQHKNCRVYVADFGKRGNRQELERAFGFYGPLRRVWVAQCPPGFAFVEFKDPQNAWDAVCALHGETLCGRRVRVQSSTRKRRISCRRPSCPLLQAELTSVSADTVHDTRSQRICAKLESLDSDMACILHQLSA
ncbi:hypothetical protein HPB50_003183 [Hyalomma asiaticum]|uniref:Uncharacterized protein n=1 Tax=Hyalomma asiaticum TaxID=266040 RepID=A0ACB7T5R7_HYAAI|nr:hypothetical protein HPB50_003183 [Hyalomma asiaticum]